MAMESEHSALAVTQQFRPITLAEMDGVQLLNRMDTKYVMPIGKLAPFLEMVKNGYRILHTNPLRYTDYDSLYFDTPDFQLYAMHHRGKAGRYKVRCRGYADTKMFFLEIKHKNNKGRTDKSRSQRFGIEQQLSSESLAFIARKTTLNPRILEAKLQVQFSRMTLVNNAENERLTIDFNLSFTGNGTTYALPGIVVVEIKQSSFSSKSDAIAALRHLKVRESNMSKYCIGAAHIYPALRSNNFKEVIHTITKLQHDGTARNQAA